MTQEDKQRLESFSTEELKAEIKRRAEIARAKKAEEMKNALRCRNCKHCVSVPISSWWSNRYSYECVARTWGKKHPRHYTISPSKRACELFERKEE